MLYAQQKQTRDLSQAQRWPRTLAQRTDLGGVRSNTLEYLTFNVLTPNNLVEALQCLINASSHELLLSKISDKFEDSAIVRTRLASKISKR